jgi:ABC-type transport system substrate-binding protein
LQKWSGYWEPKVQTVAGYEFIGNGADYQLFPNEIEAGQLNYGTVQAPQLPLLQSGKSNGTLNYKVTPSGQYGELYMNFNSAPFNNVLVRQALEYAINRSQIVTALTQGTGVVAWSPLPPNSPAYNPAVKDMYPYNPTKAKQLLAEAGYPNGVTINAANPPGGGLAVEAAAITPMLAQAGFTLKLIPVVNTELGTDIYIKKLYNASVGAFSGDADPGILLESHFGSHGQYNAAGTTVAGLDNLFARADAATSPATRNQLLKQADLIVMQNALDVPIYFYPGITAYSPNLQNVTYGSTGCEGGYFVSAPISVK